MPLHTAVNHFDIEEISKKLVLLGMQDAEIAYLNMLTFGKASDQNKHIIYEQPRWANKGRLPNGVNNTATTGIQATPNLTRILQANQVIQINGEQMLIESVDKTANTFDVKGRGHAGTPIVAHPANAILDIVGTADPEGVVTKRYEKSQRVPFENFFQEMTEDVEITLRAERKSHKDRKALLNEERLNRMIAHLEKLNKTLRMGVGFYDGVQGQHTLKGYEQLINDANGITQGVIGYTNGSFGLNDWHTMQLELARRLGKKVTHIHTNTMTKEFLIGLVGAAYQNNDNNQGTMGNTMGTHYDSIILEKIGTKVYFILDESIDGYSASLIDINKHMIIPAKSNGGGDHLFKVMPETSNSKIIHETLESELSLEVQHAERQVVLKNLQ